jgi:hypothetical protein
MNPRQNTWRTWREALTVVLAASNVKRTVCIALVVGSVFFAMNQLGTVVAGEAGTIIWLKVALTYLTPLVVSNVGVLSTTRRVT